MCRWLRLVCKGRRRRKRVSSRLGLLEVVRVLRVLEGVALADAAVYHTGEMHRHGEGRVTGHGSVA